jgi:translation elongation factor EF-Tu-like GTPase
MIEDPTTPPLTDPTFHMPIDEFFTLDNVGLMVVGRIQQGQVKAGDTVSIVGPGPDKTRTLKAQIKNVEVRGDSLGLILEDITDKQIEPGMIVTTEGVTPAP